MKLKIKKDKICYLKLFLTDSNWTWYIIQIDKNCKILVWLLDGLEQELGYFKIKELKI